MTEEFRPGALPETRQQIDRYLKMGTLARTLQLVHDKLAAESETPQLQSEEEKLAWLRVQRDAGNVEGSTQELRVVAALPSEQIESTGESLSERQKEAARRLKEREAHQPKEQRVRDSLNKLGGRRPPDKDSSGR